VNALSEIFKALSDESRLRIYGLIVNSGELCVCDIEVTLRFSQTKVSRHLSVLRRAGLVQDRRKGLWILYSAVRPKGQESRLALKAFWGVMKKNATLQADARTLAKIIKRGACATSTVLDSNHVPAALKRP
jgi:ArsR family transcriptional regulator